MALQWRTMTDDERDRAYSPSSCLPDGDYRPFVSAYADRSDEAWHDVLTMADVTATTIDYGPAESQSIDLAIPNATEEPPALLVYIHGGYWQELSREVSRFSAADAVMRGCAFAAIGYTLAPEATLGDIVDECCAAVQLLHDQASHIGFDPERIFVAGSSAGAHLSAMVAHRLTDLVRGTVLVSGIYELEPLIGTSINEALELTVESAAQNSPLHFDLGDFPPSLIAYGDNETSEFKAQSAAFAQRLADAGVRHAIFEVPDRNHFDVILDLTTPDTVVGEAVSTFAERT